MTTPTVRETAITREGARVAPAHWAPGYVHPSTVPPCPLNRALGAMTLAALAAEIFRSTGALPDWARADVQTRPERI